MHQHTATCKKGGRAGGHEDCRMGYDRPLVNKSHRYSDGHVLLRRTHGNIVPFIPGLLLGCPCNHFMSATLDAGRYTRDLHLWKDAHVAGKTQVCDVVVLPTGV